MSDLQRTLRSAVALEGVGLHHGARARVVLRSAGEGTGIVFVRDGVEVAGVAENVVDTSRGTTLGASGLRIMTVEHIMAALRGSGVDNARVEALDEEMPALDGSARPMVEAIESVGTVSQTKPRRRRFLREPVSVEASGGRIVAKPCERLKISYAMSYAHPMIGDQSIAFAFGEEAFREEIAPARTFVLYEEVAELLSRRLAQGGSLSNTIVIWQDRLSCDLRFPDELVRHKALDVIGDLALIGGPLCADIEAERSGHALNVELARRIRETGVCDG